MKNNEMVDNQVVTLGGASDIVSTSLDLPNSKERISNPELFVCPWDTQHGDTTYFR